MNPSEKTLTATAEIRAPEQDLAAKSQIASEKVADETDVETNVSKKEKEDHMDTAEPKEEKLEKIEADEIIAAGAQETQDALDGKKLAANLAEESASLEASAEKINAENVAAADDEAVIEDKDESSNDVIEE